jgi:hypothetical protein
MTPRHRQRHWALWDATAGRHAKEWDGMEYFQLSTEQSAPCNCTGGVKVTTFFSGGDLRNFFNYSHLLIKTFADATQVKRVSNSAPPYIALSPSMIEPWIFLVQSKWLQGSKKGVIAFLTTFGCSCDYLVCVVLELVETQRTGRRKAVEKLLDSCVFDWFWWWIWLNWRAFFVCVFPFGSRA